MREYERGLPTGQVFDEQVQVATVVHGSTGKLREQLMSKKVDNFDDLKVYGEEFFEIRRPYVSTEVTGNGVIPMDVDYVGKGKSKDSKGKGKGKDKGKHGKGKPQYGYQQHQKGKSKGKGKSKDGKGKDHSGKGKGSSSNTVQGYCTSCGKWGHK